MGGNVNESKRSPTQDVGLAVRELVEDRIEIQPVGTMREFIAAGGLPDRSRFTLGKGRGLLWRTGDLGGKFGIVFVEVVEFRVATDRVMGTGGFEVAFPQLPAFFTTDWDDGAVGRVESGLADYLGLQRYQLRR